MTDMPEFAKRIYADALCRLFAQFVRPDARPHSSEQLKWDNEDLARADKLALLVLHQVQLRFGPDVIGQAVEGWAHVEVMGKQEFFGWTRDLRETPARMLEVRALARDGSPGDVKRFGAGAIYCCTFLRGDDPEGDCKHLAAGERQFTCRTCNKSIWGKSNWRCEPDCLECTAARQNQPASPAAFEPGEVHGPAKCPQGACSECDGEHHWIEECPNPDDPGEYKDHPALQAGLSAFYVCKHCPAWSEMDEVDNDDDPF